MPTTFTEFYIFYAPFLVLIAALVVGFFIAPKDEAVVNGGRKGKRKLKK
ncbi:hypothetical protein [Sporosarcina sp. Te-1]|nr:hypothetical protein [Sporosarcina sp. Te-1]QTD43026.1 hypothetical protein J3U78_09920 [Sporosarcina sp. Te-1]